MDVRIIEVADDELHTAWVAARSKAGECLLFVAEHATPEAVADGYAEARRLAS